MAQGPKFRPGLSLGFRLSLALNVLLVCLVVGFVFVGFRGPPPMFPPLAFLNRPPSLLEKILSASLEPDRLAEIRETMDRAFPPGENPLAPPPPPGSDRDTRGKTGSPEQLMQRFLEGSLTQAELTKWATERDAFRQAQDERMDKAILEFSKILTPEEKARLVETVKTFGKNMRACEMQALP